MSSNSQSHRKSVFEMIGQVCLIVNLGIMRLDCFAQSTQLKVQEQNNCSTSDRQLLLQVFCCNSYSQYSKASGECNQFIQENRISTAPATPDPADFMADFAKVSFPRRNCFLSVFVASIANRKRLKRLSPKCNKANHYNCCKNI
jgi:hypothetical protein